MSVMILILGAVFALALVAVIVVVVIALWPREGKLGINLKNVNCPRCATPMPATRLPKNTKQVLWGGWTCPKCGCEIDKYGAEVPGRAG